MEALETLRAFLRLCVAVELDQSNPAPVNKATKSKQRPHSYVVE